MKVLIISPCGLPVPAVKGGAVATLIDSLVEQNERKNQLDITVVGSYDENAVKQSMRYKHTNFIFLKKTCFSRVADKCFGLVFKIIFGRKKEYHKYFYKLSVVRRLKKIMLSSTYDKIVFQNVGFILLTLKNQKICAKYENNLFYHLHNDVPKNVYLNGLLKCKLLLISRYLEIGVKTLCSENGISNLPEMFVLHNGIDVHRFAQIMTSEEKHELKSSLNIGDEKKIVIFAGRIDPSKGIKQLAEAFTDLKKDDVILMIVGPSDFGAKEPSDFDRTIREMLENIRDRVRFTGYIKYEEMWKYYKIADIAVLPSMWNEPAGLTIIEAMAAGLPVITTNSGGIPEYVDKDTCILLERDEDIVQNITCSINDVLNNYDLWKQNGELACKHIVQTVNEECFFDNFARFLTK